MRLDKSQVPSSYRYTANTTFNRDLAIMAGYRTFDAMVVGAAGGYSGQASGTVPGFTGTVTLFKNPGGGGGSMRKQDLLTALEPMTPVSVGVVGTNGANVGVTSGVTPAGPGGKGGTSSLGATVSATGGDGGTGGYLRSNGAYGAGRGGNGGIGIGAVAGVGGSGRQPGQGAATAGTAGTWVSSGGGGTGGGGGGGGAGAKVGGEFTSLNAVGGSGAQGGDNSYRSPISNVAMPVNDGQGGAGANVAPFTGGSAEHFGTPIYGNPAGVVLLKIA